MWHISTFYLTIGRNCEWAAFKIEQEAPGDDERRTRTPSSQINDLHCGTVNVLEAAEAAVYKFPREKKGSPQPLHTQFINLFGGLIMMTTIAGG